MDCTFLRNGKGETISHERSTIKIVADPSFTVVLNDISIREYYNWPYHSGKNNRDFS